MRCRIVGALVLSGGVALAGCVSTDATPDVADAAAMVRDRAGPTPAWDAPWDEASLAWDGAGPLTADQAVASALQNNRQVRAALEGVGAARAAYAQADRAPNPVISLAFGVPLDGLGGRPLALSLMQQLSWLWTRPARLDAAEAQLRVEVLAAADEALRLVAAVRTAHASVVLGERAAAIDADNLRMAREAVDLVERLYAAGEATRFDVNRASIAASGVETRLLERRGRVERDRRTLLWLLGRSDADANFPTAGDPPNAGRAARAIDERAVIELAATRRLDVAAAYEAVGVRDAGLRLARVQRWPELSLGVGFQRNFQDRPGVFPGGVIAPPLLDPGDAREAGAEARARRAVIEADGAMQRAVLEGRRALTSLRAATAVAARIDADVRRPAGENARLAQRAYDAGVIDLTQLLEAQRAEADAAVRRADAEAAALEALFELERAVGGEVVLGEIAPDEGWGTDG